MKQEEIFKLRLKRAIEKQNAHKRRMRAKRIKGLHLLEQLPKIAKELGFDVEEMAVFYKIKGSKQDRAIYISRRGSRVDLAGFSVDNPAFITVPEEEIKKRHLGRIRARLVLNLPDDVVLNAYKRALEELNDRQTGESKFN